MINYYNDLYTFEHEIGVSLDSDNDLDLELKLNVTQVKKTNFYFKPKRQETCVTDINAQLS